MNDCTHHRELVVVRQSMRKILQDTKTPLPSFTQTKKKRQNSWPFQLGRCIFN